MNALRITLVIAPVFAFSACQMRPSETHCEIVRDTLANPFAPHTVDYSGRTHEWINLNTGELIGYSASEDAPIYNLPNC